MKVLNVNSLLDPVSGGGTVERTLQVSRFMRQAGIDCRILTTSVGLTADALQLMEAPEITVLPCLNARFRIPQFDGEKIRSIVERADVVHLMDHWTVLNAIVYRAARRMNKPYVVCPAGALPIYGRSKVFKKVYNRFVGYGLVQNASGHVAITDMESRQFEPYGVDRARVTVIPNGVDCDAFADRNDTAFRDKYGLGTSPFILFLGRLNSIKGPDLLLRAFLNAGNVLRGYHLVFAGPDGGMLSELKETVACAGAGERVHFVGYVGGTEKSWAYSAADCVVVPSRQEAMSIVALEAGAAGTPVIMTDQCGFDDLAASGGGIIVGVSVESLQEGMKLLLSSGEHLADMGEKLRNYVRSNYDWDSVVEKYRAMYSIILEHH